MTYIILIATLFILLLSIYFYIRLKYGFWYYQPVFHMYDLRYYFLPPGIIMHDLPDKNRYTNFKQVETLNFDKVSKVRMNQFINFVQLHYLKNKDNRFLPKKENVAPYFVGNNSPSFFSFYYEDQILHDIKTGAHIEDKKLISVMTGKPLHVNINNRKKDAFFDVYYVDYLCVDVDYRKKGIAPEIIQTHEYNQRHLNKNISVSLFKREGQLTGIVPLCVFNTYGFSMKHWAKPHGLDPQYSLVEGNSKNMHFLIDFLKNKNTSFDICILPDFSNLMELIKTGNVFVYFILHDNEIIAAYFFRKTCIYMEKDCEVITCFASINGTGTNPDLFIHGFKVALYKIASSSKSYKYAAIESISNNQTIIDNLVLRTKPVIVSPTAYFFYNFAYPTFKSEKVLILC